MTTGIWRAVRSWYRWYPWYTDTILGHRVALSSSAAVRATMQRVPPRCVTWTCGSARRLWYHAGFLSSAERCHQHHPTVLDNWRGQRRGPALTRPSARGHQPNHRHTHGPAEHPAPGSEEHGHMQPRRGLEESILHSRHHDHLRFTALARPLHRNSELRCQALTPLRRSQL